MTIVRHIRKSMGKLRQKVLDTSSIGNEFGVNEL